MVSSMLCCRSGCLEETFVGKESESVRGVVVKCFRLSLQED